MDVKKNLQKKQYALMSTFVVGKDYSKEDEARMRKAGARAGRKQAKRDLDAIMAVLKK